MRSLLRWARYVKANRIFWRICFDLSLASRNQIGFDRALALERNRLLLMYLHQIRWTAISLPSFFRGREIACSKIEDRLLWIRRMFFTFAFLGAGSVSCEGGEKQRAENKILLAGRSNATPNRNDLVCRLKRPSVFQLKTNLSRIDSGMRLPVGKKARRTDGG